MYVQYDVEITLLACILVRGESILMRCSRRESLGLMHPAYFEDIDVCPEAADGTSGCSLREVK